MPEWIEEKNYFFRLSAYQDRAARALRRAARLRPAGVSVQRGAQLHRGRAPGLRRSAARASRGASRSRGTRSRSPTSGSTRSINYLSALTYARPGEDLASGSGRTSGICSARTSCASTASSGRRCCSPPATSCREQLFVHGYLLLDDRKISKSLGNVDRPARPDRRLRRRRRSLLGCARGAVRPGRQRRRSTSVHERYERELGNDLGNLVSRTTAMIARYRDGRRRDRFRTGDDAGTRRARARRSPRGSTRFDITGRARRDLGARPRRSTGTSRRRRPGSSRRTRRAPSELDRVLYDLADGVRAVAVALSAYLPETAPRILAALGQPRRSVAWADVGARRARSQPKGSSRRRRSSRASKLRPPRRDRHARAPRRVRRAAATCSSSAREPPASTRILTVGTRHRVLAGRARRSPSGTTASSPPSASTRTRRRRDATRRRAARAARASDAPSRSARPGSTTTATTRRATRSGSSSSAQLALAAELGKPVVDPHARGRRRHARAALGGFDGDGRPALLLVAGAARAGARARLVRLVRRQRHLPEGARAARRRRARCPPTGCSPRPTSPYLAPQPRARPAERAGQRACTPSPRSPRRAARTPAELAAQIDANAARAFGLP